MPLGFTMDPQWVEKDYSHKALLYLWCQPNFAQWNSLKTSFFNKTFLWCFTLWLYICHTHWSKKSIHHFNSYPIKIKTVTLKITCILRSFKFVRQPRFCQQRISTVRIHLIGNWSNYKWQKLIQKYYKNCNNSQKFYMCNM